MKSHLAQPTPWVVVLLAAHTALFACGPDSPDVHSAASTSAPGGFASAPVVSRSAIVSAAEVADQALSADPPSAAWTAPALSCLPSGGSGGTNLSRTTVTSSRNPAIFGGAISYTATVSGQTGMGTPTGQVVFTSDGVTICCASLSRGEDSVTCVADACTAAGRHKVVASYQGDGVYASSSSDLTQELAKADPAAALTLNPNPATVGQPVIIAAKISLASAEECPLKGQLAFYSNSVPIPGCSSLPLTPGTCTTTYGTAGFDYIKVFYGGDDNTNRSSIELRETVNRDATLTRVTVSPTAAVVGQSVVYQVLVKRDGPGTCVPDGRVTLTDNGAPIAGCPTTLSSGQLSCITSYAQTGHHVIAAAYEGNSACNASSAQVATNVGKASALTTISADVSPVDLGQPVTYTAAISVVSPGQGHPSGTVQFYDNGAAIADCGMVPLLALDPVQATCQIQYDGRQTGAHQIVAVYSGDSYFLGSSSSGSTVQVRGCRVEGTLVHNSTPRAVFVIHYATGSRPLRGFEGVFGSSFFEVFTKDQPIITRCYGPGTPNAEVEITGSAAFGTGQFSPGDTVTTHLTMDKGVPAQGYVINNRTNETFLISPPFSGSSLAITEP